MNTIVGQVIISRSEIKHIADTEFDELHVLEHVDLGELDIVESRTDRQDMSEELRLVDWGCHTRDVRCGELRLGMDTCQGSSPILCHM